MKRDEAWKKAEGAQGVEKAKFLAAGLKVLDEDMASQHYSQIIAEITKLDPKDETGVGASMTFKADLAKLQTDLTGIAKEGSDGVRKAADAFIASHTRMTVNQKQTALISLLRFYRPPKDNDTVLKLMGDVKALDPQSEAGEAGSADRGQGKADEREIRIGQAGGRLAR